MTQVERLETNYIETFTGKRFWPLNPIVEDIDIVDIAHALSNKCRYTGHTREFYSVAQHSVLMAEIVSTPYKMEALLHDAVEAYLPDIAFPLRGAFNGFAKTEEHLHILVADRFNTIWPLPKEVKMVDRKITRDEAWHLMHSQGRYWPGSTDRIGVDVESWSPHEAERRFLDAYAEQVELRKIPDPWHIARLTHLHNVFETKR
jgi:hypothetical protein